MSSESPPSASGLVTNFFYSAISAGSAVLLLALTIVAGRILGDQEYGKFWFALSLATIFETLMDLGLHQSTIRWVARERGAARRILQNSLGLKLVWTAIGLATLAAVATLLRSEADVRIACYLLGISAVLKSYLLTVRGILLGLERFGWEALLVVVDRVLLLGVGTAALYAHLGVEGLSVAFVAARVLAVGFAVLVAGRQIGNVRATFERDVWRELQTSAVTLGMFLIVLNLYSYIDSVMLGLMRSDSDTGIYGAGYRIYEGLTFAPMILAAVLTPRLSRYFVEDRHRYARLIQWGLGGAGTLAILAVVATFPLAEPVVTLLYGPTFAPSAVVLRILSGGLLFVFPIWILHSIAISSNAERLLLMTTMIGCVVNVVLNYLLIPRYGGQGSATATVVGEGVVLIILSVGLWRSHTRLASTPASGNAPAAAG